ncbi:hypothetical protein PIPA1_02510 [Pelosinus sp. IPA-1]|nr:hypothetical protein PIPA1_02510 [Pelosinus sp. IPA-1]
MAEKKKPLKCANGILAINRISASPLVGFVPDSAGLWLMNISLKILQQEYHQLQRILYMY